MSEDIFEQVTQIVASTPAHRALAKCDEVQRFIRHAQIDGKWGDPLDQGYLLFVSQHTMPDGTPVFLSGIACGSSLIVHMLLAEKEGEYVKLSLDAMWGNMQTVSGGEA